VFEVLTNNVVGTRNIGNYEVGTYF